MSFAVTATEGGATDIGMSLYISVLTGFAASPIGSSATVSSATPAIAVTPAATGSKVYASILGLQGTFSPNGSTAVKDDSTRQGLEFLALWTSGTTTSGTPVTVGGTLTANGISACGLEIKSGTGLTEDASTPGVAVSSNTNVVSVPFNPPNGSLLVALVESNGGAGACTMALTDSSGLGLTWTEQIRASTATAGYSGIWTTLMPGSAASAATPAPLVVPSLAAIQAACW